MSLTKWFNEKWVDISTTKDGKHPACGRKMGDGRKGYPKCVPSAKASRMTAAEKKSAVRRKRATNPSSGKKPTYART
ncbi:MAG: hypothetical protein VW879_02425 [Opitutae bacterium]